MAAQKKTTVHIKPILEKTLRILFPRRCPVCDDIVTPAGEKICPACRSRLHFITEPVCRVCGKEILEETEELCENCRKHSFDFVYGRALLGYNDAAASSMGRIKTGGRREYLDYYAEEAAARLGPALLAMHVDALVPVPVHPDRLRARGYNQAEVLADQMGRLLGIPVFPRALKRKRNTKALKTLGADTRQNMLRTAFQADIIPDDLRCVLLIDDIFTTGSTMQACTRTLLDAGVEAVYCFSLCIRADY